MSIIGLFLLIRINILLMLCIVSNAGSINNVKKNRKNLDRIRQATLQKCSFTSEDLSILKSLKSNYESMEG